MLSNKIYRTTTKTTKQANLYLEQFSKKTVKQQLKRKHYRLNDATFQSQSNLPISFFVVAGKKNDLKNSDNWDIQNRILKIKMRSINANEPLVEKTVTKIGLWPARKKIRHVPAETNIRYLWREEVKNRQSCKINCFFETKNFKSHEKNMFPLKNKKWD